MSLTDLLVPIYRQTLGSLAGRLDKVLQQRADGAAEDILAARLAPDMHPLAAQVRFAAFQAQEAAYRLTGQALPDRLGQDRRRGLGGAGEARHRGGEGADHGGARLSGRSGARCPRWRSNAPDRP